MKKFRQNRTVMKCTKRGGYKRNVTAFEEKPITHHAAKYLSPSSDSGYACTECKQKGETKYHITFVVKPERAR